MNTPISELSINFNRLDLHHNFNRHIIIWETVALKKKITYFFASRLYVHMINDAKIIHDTKIFYLKNVRAFACTKSMFFGPYIFYIHISNVSLFSFLMSRNII